MAGDRLPIVFKSNIWGAALTAIACALCVWAGIAIVNGDYYSRGAHFGPIHLSSEATGWFLLAVGIPLGLVAAMAAVRGCPNLTLTEQGLTLSRCFGGAVTIAWSELAHVTIRSMRVRRGMVRVVYLVTKDGRDISVGPVRGKAEEIAETIRHVAGTMGVR
ncbi:MAG TPA: hypothetical protein VHC71_10365 [Hyphomicrobium sp.]|nr:hypothetical protein [Hyphomicrobium sp.]